MRMNLIIDVLLYLGIAYQLLRPVDPMKYQPRYIKRYEVVLIRIWRVIKFMILYYVSLFILALFGVNYN